MKIQKKNIGDESNLAPRNLSHLREGIGIRSTNMFYGAMPILFKLARELRDNQT